MGPRRDGEEEIGKLLARLEPDCWFAVHDVDTGRGNIDHVVVGPGGLFTIETKSHGGRIAIDRVDERMLKQAYAQKKWVERVTGEQTEALLVFSRAYLDRALAPRRGVLVMSGRVLCGHLLKRERCLSDARVTDLQLRLAAALG